MLIPEATINKIIDTADIVSIVGEFVKLEKKGNDYVGICPFHNDSNPSLHVSPNKKIYKCFSCGAAGNVITFMQRFKGLTYPQSIKYVGDKCGISVELSDNLNTQNFQKYYKITKEATSFYELFLKNSKEGVLALDYLHNRGLDDQIIKRFKIGLASSELNVLYESLTKRDNPFLPLDLITVGLVKVNNKNEYYDLFRERLIFPIDDINGNIVGFSGRIYKDSKKEEPKYVNSNENIIFKKGNILYNYSSCYNEIKRKDRVFLFEGFMDVIAAYRANVYNTIASMGTALTNQQIKTIKKVTNNIVLCFDGDNPGIIATKRAIKLLIAEKMNVRVMLLPNGIDPDEYLKLYGKDKLNEFLENGSISPVDYLYEIEKRDLNIQDISSIENFRKNVFSFLKLFNSKIISDNFIKKMSKDLNITIDSLDKDYQQTEANETIINVIDEKEKKDLLKSHQKNKYIIAENKLIYLMILKRENYDTISNLIPVYICYIDKVNRNIIYKIYDFYNTNSIDNLSNNGFMNTLNEEEKSKIDYILQAYKKVIGSDSISRLVETIQGYANEKLIEDVKNDTENGEEITIEKLVNFSKAKKKLINIKNEE